MQGERAVFLVDIMNPCWIYRGADLSEVDAIAASVGQVPFNFQIGDDVKKIPLRKPQSRGGRAGGAHRQLRRREDRHAAARAGGEELRGD